MNKNPVASCPKLEEQIIELEEKCVMLQAENEALRFDLKMTYGERLEHEIVHCTSPGLVPTITAKHLIEAIRSLNPRVDLMELIERFHLKFGLGYDGPPRFLSKPLSDFRIKFLHEELKEYRDAVEEKDLEKQFDALIDLVYVALGTAYLQGFPFNVGFGRVHDANMKKVRAATTLESKRGSKFDVVKPPNWKPPYLKDLV